MVKYTDYRFYKEVYNGTMPETSFNRIIVAASSYLRKITFDKVQEGSEPERVKRACCAMCDVINNAESAKVGGRTVKSENNDGYSVTFVTGTDGQSESKALQRELYSTAELYLSGTDLLNMRCDYDNEC